MHQVFVSSVLLERPTVPSDHGSWTTVTLTLVLVSSRTDRSGPGQERARQRRRAELQLPVQNAGKTRLPGLHRL